MVRKILGLLFIILPFLPLFSWAGDPVDLTYSYTGYDWFLGIAIVTAVAWCLCYVPVILAGIFRAAVLVTRLSDRAFELVSLVWIATTSLITASRTFNNRPHLIDAIVQLFQAKIFAAGRVSVPAPSHLGFFLTQHMLFDDGKWYSQYAPGHALLEAVGYCFGSPLLAMITVSVVTASVIFRTTRNMYGSHTARLVLLMLSLSSFFIFMSASYMNHISALFFSTIELYAFERLKKTNKIFYAILIGAALGYGFTVRSLDFIAAGAAIMLMCLRSLYADKEVSLKFLVTSSFFVGIGGVLTAAPYFIYNKLTTGSYLLPGFIKLWGHAHDLGFHATPWGEVHTPLRGVLNQLITINLLNEYLFESAVPVLVIIGIALVCGGLKRAWDFDLLLGFLAVPFLYVFYWHRDSFLGPRYLYTTLPFILPLLARSFEEVFILVGNRTFGKAGIIKPVPARSLIIMMILVSVAYSVGYGIPSRESLYRTGMSSMKLDIALLAREKGINNAIIFVPVSWGGRIIAELRELGVSASAVEKTYRTVDHCELQQLIDRSLLTPMNSAVLEDELEKRIASHEPVQKVRLNDDPTLRLRTDVPLTEGCKEQITYDQHWYTNYEPHLLENDPRLTGSLIFARDLRERNSLLLAEYPNRTGYLFDGQNFTVLQK